MDFEITKIGERGQLVIPQEFRKSMDIKKGEKFIVIERADALILKRLKAPSLKEVDAMMAKGHERARRLNLTPEDLVEVRKRSRSKK